MQSPAKSSPQPDIKTVCGGGIQDISKSPDAGKSLFLYHDVSKGVSIQPRCIYGWRSGTSSR